MALRAHLQWLVQALPQLPRAIVIDGLFSARKFLTALALGHGTCSMVTRVVRAAAFGLRGQLHVIAALPEATLSFVGLTDHTMPGWGHIMAHAGPYLRDAWWLWLFPGGLW